MSPPEIENFIMVNNNEIDDFSEDRPPFYVEIPESLKTIAERDNLIVYKKKRLLNLPANPNIITILEGYVKNFAVNILCSSTEKHKPGSRRVIPPERNIDLCKEIVCGLRLMFDFVLATKLLYGIERQQHETQLSSYVPPIKVLLTPLPSPMKMEQQSPFECVEESHEATTLNDDTTPAIHLPSPPKHKRKRTVRVELAINIPQKASQSKRINEDKNCARRAGRFSPRIKSHEKSTDNIRKDFDKKLVGDTVDMKTEVKELAVVTDDTTKRVTRRASAADVHDKTETETHVRTAKKRTRLHASAQEAVKTESALTASVPIEIKIPPTPLSAPLPTLAAGGAMSPPRLRPRDPCEGCGLEDASLMKSDAVTDIMRWRLIADSLYYDKPPIPSLIYGAHHLLRLLTKISEFVSPMPMPDEKRQILGKHLDMIIAYLRDRRDELFPDSAYEGNSDIRTRRH